MPAKSILDLEEARRRLERMSEDHQELVDLIDKLKSMRDALTDVLEKAQSTTESTAEQMGAAEATLRALKQGLAEFQQESEATLADVFSAGTKAEATTQKLEREVRKRIDEIVGEMRTAGDRFDTKFAARIKEQEAQFDEFRKQHDAAVTQLKEAYDRARATLESHNPLIDRLDRKVDKLLETQSESIAAVRGRAEELAQRNDDATAELRDEMHGNWERAKRRIDEVADAARREYEKASAAQTAISAGIRRIQRRLRWGRVLLWLLLLAGIGIVGFFVSSEWETAMRFWADLIERLGQGLK